VDLAGSSADRKPLPQTRYGTLLAEREGLQDPQRIENLCHSHPPPATFRWFGLQDPQRIENLCHTSPNSTSRIMCSMLAGSSADRKPLPPRGHHTSPSPLFLAGSSADRKPLPRRSDQLRYRLPCNLQDPQRIENLCHRPCLSIKKDVLLSFYHKKGLSCASESDDLSQLDQR
jgi:hypothetical protein